MRSFTYAIEIARPPETVFGFMMNFDRASRLAKSRSANRGGHAGPAGRRLRLLVTFDIWARSARRRPRSGRSTRPAGSALRNTASA